jgi:hypothetical protein
LTFDFSRGTSILRLPGNALLGWVPPYVLSILKGKVISKDGVNTVKEIFGPEISKIDFFDETEMKNFGSIFQKQVKWQFREGLSKGWKLYKLKFWFFDDYLIQYAS